MYTDGSKTRNPNSTSCALYVEDLKYSECWKLRPAHSIISAELYGILQALIFLQNNYSPFVIIFTDSLSGLQLLLTPQPKTYVNIVNQIKIKLLELNDSGTVILHWVKGHCGVRGNEIADRAADKGHKNNRSELYPLTKEEITSELKMKFKDYWNEYWSSNMELSGKGLFLKSIRDSVGDLQPVGALRSRRSEILIHRLRIGHVNLNQSCLLYTSPSPRDKRQSRMPSSA